MASTKDSKKEQVLNLSIDQQRALELLLSGNNDRETAEEVGVARATVTKWRLYHPVFKAELNRRRLELYQVGNLKLQQLIPKALKALEKAVEEDVDWKAAIEILKAVGIYGKPQVAGKTEPEEIVKAMRPDPRFASVEPPPPTEDEMEELYGEILEKLECRNPL